MAVKRGSKSKVVYFSPKEWENVCAKAEEANLRVGTYIRVISAKGEIKKVDMRAVNELRLEVSRIGNNINQIVHLANKTQTVAKKDVESLKAKMDEIKSILNHWIKSLWM